MKPNLLEIDTAESLAVLQNETRRGGPRKFTGFPVRVPGANDAANDEWRHRIERDYFACGCAHGTVAGLAAVAACIAWVASRAGGWSSLSWTDGLLSIAVFVAATGLGKLIGIRVARRRLRATLAELARFFPRKAPLEGPAQPTAQCAVH